MKKEQMNEANVEKEKARVLTDEEAAQTAGGGTDPKAQRIYEFHIYTTPSNKEAKKTLKKIFEQPCRQERHRTDKSPSKRQK